MVMDDQRRIATACAMAALAISAAAVAFTIGFAGWEPSILVRMSETEPMAGIARAHDPGFVLVPPEAHYDGVYFYAIALDPFARNEDVYKRIDLYEYRYGHPGYGWLSGMVALGEASRVPLAMLLVSLAGMGVAGWAVSRIAHELGRSPWWGLLIAVNPGLIFAVTVLNSEPLGVALAALGLLAWQRGRLLLGAALFAGACLVKELFLIVPAGLVLWEVAETVRHRAAPGILFRTGILVASAFPLALWYLYLKFHFGVFPAEAEPGNIGTPLVGWFDTFRYAVALSTSGASQIGTFTIAQLTITAGAMLVGAVRAVRLRSPFDVMFLLLFVLASTVNWFILLYPKDLIRELLLAFLLLPAVVVGVRWRPRAPEAGAAPSTTTRVRRPEPDRA
jgi:hypothetical protein